MNNLLKKIFFVFLVLLIWNPVHSQDYAVGNAKPLFTSHEVIRFTIRGDFSTLLRDIGKERDEHLAILEYADGSDTVQLNIKLETRGNFRRARENCNFPPLKVNFKKKQVRGTWFDGLDKVKLVTQCISNRKKYQEYVLEEYLIYRHFNIITDTSFRVRLALIDYVDTNSGKRTEQSYAFFIESDDAFEDRFDATEIKTKYLLQDSTRVDHVTKLAIFQYMIGNTDWAVTTLHNIKLFVTDPEKPPYAIPYDFDWSGLIETEYARPLPKFGIQSVEERLYRGYCRSIETYKEYFALFAQKKDDIYALYQEFDLLRKKDQKRIIKYLDDFYKITGNDKSIKSEFLDACLR
ncbi:MAG: hypothetical protein ACLFPE_05695 [Bacteroidales bacterium]